MVLSGFESSAISSVLLSAKHGYISFTCLNQACGGGSAVEDGGNVTVSGTQDEINTALRSVWYAAPPDWNSPGQGAFETLSVLVDERDSTRGGDPYPGVPRTLLVKVAPVNDPPSIKGPANVATLEGRHTAIRGIEIHDVDAQETRGGAIEVTASISKAGGVVEPGSKLGLFFDRISNESKTFHGSLMSINTALAGLVFRGPPEFSGMVELDLTVDDRGNTGEGGSLSSFLTIPISVDSVNNPPEVRRDGGLLRGPEDKVMKVDGILIEDPDALGEKIRMTLEALYGTVSLRGDRSELEFMVGSGLRDSRMVVIGTLEVRDFNTLDIAAIPPGKTHD